MNKQVMRITKNKIKEAILSETGHSVEIQTEWNYFWFWSNDDYTNELLNNAQSQSVCVFRLSDLSIDSWVSEFKRIIKSK